MNKLIILTYIILANFYVYAGDNSEISLAEWAKENNGIIPENLTDAKDKSVFLSVDLSNKKLIDIKGLADLKVKRFNELVSLKETPNLNLNLSNNKLESLEGLSDFEELEVLNVNNNKLVSLEYLPETNLLNKVYANNNNLTSLKELPNLPELETLDVTGNQINLLEGLENVPNLKYLYLNDNKLSSIIGLPDLDKLVLLDVSNNNLTSLDGLNISKKPNFINLSVANNSIKFINIDILEHFNMLPQEIKKKSLIYIVDNPRLCSSNDMVLTYKEIINKRFAENIAKRNFVSRFFLNIISPIIEDSLVEQYSKILKNLESEGKIAPYCALKPLTFGYSKNPKITEDIVKQIYGGKPVIK